MDLASFLFPRVRRFLLPLVLSDEDLLDDMRATLTHVKKPAPSIGAALVRTWCNGWCTETRFGSVAAADSECRFGCGAEGAADRLSHYLSCTRLWVPPLKAVRDLTGFCWKPSVIASLVLRKPTATFVDDDYEVRLQTLAVVLDIYNTTAHAQMAGEERPLPITVLFQRTDEAVRRIERVTTFVNRSFKRQKSHRECQPLLSDTGALVRSSDESAPTAKRLKFGGVLSVATHADALQPRTGESPRFTTFELVPPPRLNSTLSSGMQSVGGVASRVAYASPFANF
jgi:hypothetical protein